MKIVKFENKTYLGTKEVEIQVNKNSYIVNVIAYGSWYIEEIEKLEGVLNYLKDFNIPENELLEIKEMIKMSNSCINKIILPNLTDKEIELLKEKIISKDDFDDDYFDFNKIIKRPDNMLLRAFKDKTLNSFSKYYYENPDNLSKELLESIVKDNVLKVIIRDEVVNIQDYVEELYSNKELEDYRGEKLILWYDWCRKNWGTKWNSIWTTLNKTHLTFSTAWDPISINLFSYFLMICRDILGDRADTIILEYDEYNCNLHGKYIVGENKEIIHIRENREEVA